MILMICCRCGQGALLYRNREKSCPCGKARGLIKDYRLHASRDALLIGLANGHVIEAIRTQEPSPWSRRIEALAVAPDIILETTHESNPPDPQVPAGTDGNGTGPRHVSGSVPGADAVQPTDEWRAVAFATDDEPVSGAGSTGTQATTDASEPGTDAADAVG